MRSQLPGLCLQRRLHILCVWNLLKTLIGQRTLRDSIKLLHFLSLAGSPALRYTSSLISDGNVPEDFFYIWLKKSSCWMPGDPRVPSLKKKDELQHFVMSDSWHSAPSRQIRLVWEACRPGKQAQRSPRRNHRK